MSVWRKCSTNALVLLLGFDIMNSSNISNTASVNLSLFVGVSISDSDSFSNSINGSVSDSVSVRVR